MRPLYIYNKAGSRPDHNALERRQGIAMSLFFFLPLFFFVNQGAYGALLPDCINTPSSMSPSTDDRA